MAYVAETENYTPSIYQLEETDPVLGGPDGIDNLQAKQLASRTKWLKARAMAAIRFEDIVPVDGVYNVTSDDIGRVLSVIDPGGATLNLPALAGFAKHNPITIVAADDGTASVLHLVANGGEVVENVLNSGDGVSNYHVKPGTRLVLVATVTSWVVVLKTEPVPVVAGHLPGDIVHSAAPLATRAGFFVCNGAVVDGADYPALYAAIGTLYGAGDGGTTFNLPDYRDGFLRVHNGGKGLDPGRTFGSYQADALKDHVHQFEKIQTQGSGTTSGYVRGAVEGTDVKDTDSIKGADGGAIETRPKNNSINTYIKY